MRTVPFALFALCASAACADDTATIFVDLDTGVITVPPIRIEPADRLDATIDDVQIHVDAMVEPDQQPPETTDSGTWASVLDQPVTVNLFDGTAIDGLIAGAQVPAGRITQVRVILDDTPVYVHSDESSAVTCPSCTLTGIKVITEGQPVLVPGETLAFQLDLRGTFDAERLRLDPVVVSMVER